MNLKKNFLLVIITVALMAASCSDNPAVKHRYEAEKMLHKVERGLQDARIKPELVDPETKKQIATSYGEVVDYCYTSLSDIDSNQYPVEYQELQFICFQSANRLSQVFYSTKYYDTCIYILNKLLTKVNLQPSHKMKTCLNLGQALHANGDWDSATVVYKNTQNEFYPPIDPSGNIIPDLFNLPWHIYSVVSLIGDSTEALEQRKETENYYQKLVDSFPGTNLETAGRSNLAKLYEETKQWDKMLNQLSKIVDSTGNQSSLVRLKTADVYSSRMGEFEKARKLYNELREDLTGKDTLAIPVIDYKIALIDMSEKNYLDARQALLNIKENHPGYFRTNSMAQYAVARSYELEGNWNRAITEYNYLIEQYKGSDEAMSAFLYIAGELKKKSRKTESEKWYNDAEKYYEDIITRGGSPAIKAKGMLYMADLYQIREEWEKSSKVLLNLFDNYPESNPGRRAILEAAVIYRNKLGNQAVADSLVDVLKKSMATVTEPVWEK